MIPLSVLDLAPIPEGSDATQSLRNTLDLARHAERLGYLSYWLAEHHNMRGIASAATSVVIAHVAAGTSTIRVGAGGVMLPNHAPLIIAEQLRHAGRAASRPHRPRARPRAGHRHGDGAGAAAQPRCRRRQLSAGRRRAAGLFRAAVREHARARRARRRPGRESLDPGIEHLWRAARRHARPALRLRLAFRAGRYGARARHLPLALPAVGVSRQALCDARPQRVRRAEPTRRRGCCSVRCSRPSSICAPAGRDNCRRRSRATKTPSTRWRRRCWRRRCPPPSSVRPRR